MDDDDELPPPSPLDPAADVLVSAPVASEDPLPEELLPEDDPLVVVESESAPELVAYPESGTP